MRRGLSALALVVVLVWSATAWATSVGGELTASVVYELEEGIAAMPLQAKVAFSDDLQGKGKLYLELKGTFDPVSDANNLALGEAYGAAYLGDVDLTIGRKVISWGTIDAFGPTNYFARLSEAALLQGSITGEPVTGVQVAYYSPNWSATGVVLPIFSPQQLSPMMREALLKEPSGNMILAVIESAEVPERSLVNMEWGARVETNLKGWDVQLSAYSGFEPLPGIQLVAPMGMTTSDILMPIPKAEYRRQWYVGGAVAGFVGDLGIKGEVAYGGPAPFAQGEGEALVAPLSQNKKAWEGTVALEYMVPVGSGLLIQGQYIYAGSGSLFSPYQEPAGEPGAEPEPAHYLMGRLSYNFTLEDSVELTALYSMEDGSALLLPGFTYRLPQGVELKGTLLKNLGDGEGELDLVPDQVRLSVGYRF